MLVDWLSDLAYFAEMEQMVFPHITLTTVTPTHLSANLRGGPVAELVKHIKAVTYHNLEIIETAVGLEVTIVFDSLKWRVAGGRWRVKKPATGHTPLAIN
ncbi:MAG: archease [Chloroflexi bacterium]|nr:archease [Chloroflexota bacterium]